MAASTTSATQEHFPAVHVAGTNGKGSTAASLAAILTQAGLRTGLYTSPHLVRPEERIAVDGTPIETGEFLELIATIRPLVDALEATFFEAMTALAFLYFSRRKVDIAVVEVGLGGRLDATNVIHPLLSLVTSIDLDHTDRLGTTVGQIAGEKAGIIKPGVPCLTSATIPEALEVLRSAAEAKGAPFATLWERYQIADVVLSDRATSFSLLNEHCRLAHLQTPLVGEHQVANAGLAVAAAVSLAEQDGRITAEAIRGGLKMVRWPGRLHRIGESPTTLVDAAHNPAAVRCVVKALKLFRYRRLFVVMGVMGDKDHQAMVEALAPATSSAIAVAPATTRALPAAELAATFRAQGVATRVAESPVAGLAQALALAGPEDLVLCTGSHYTVGEILAAGTEAAVTVTATS